LITRLLNSEWGLSAKAGRQLYMACITSISDYGAEVWWKNQKTYQDMLQGLQNASLRKILGTFRTSPGAAMELEANIPPVQVRLNQKCRNYALRVTTLSEDHPIRQRTPTSFPPEYSSGQDIPLESSYSDWNQLSARKPHPTQLIKVLNSIATSIPTHPALETWTSASAPWETSIQDLTDLSILKDDKETVVRNHFQLMERLILQHRPVFYTDGSKTASGTGSGLYFIQGSITRTESFTLNKHMEALDAELYAIYQATLRTLDLPNGFKNKECWIFTDSQAAIQHLSKLNNCSALYNKIHGNLTALQELRIKTHIHWISSHSYISENDIADQAAKEGALGLRPLQDSYVSFNYVKQDIKALAMEEWTQI